MAPWSRYTDCRSENNMNNDEFSIVFQSFGIVWKLKNIMTLAKRRIAIVFFDNCHLTNLLSQFFFGWVSQEVPKIDKNYSQVESQVYRSHFYVIPEGNKRGGTYPEHNFSKRFWTFFWIRFHLSSNSSRPLCTQIVISSCRYVTLYLGAAHERYFPQAFQTL